MQEVVCYTCGRIVLVSPDAELCSVCGENLRELLHPVHASKYFYERAAKLAAEEQLLLALQEIDRGLRYQPSSELRLLGAILAKRIGDFEQMRYHVAAIPVDDILRPEGEWLLRSHQLRQRELREATKGGVIDRNSALVITEAELPYAIQPALPQHTSQPTQYARGRMPGRFGYGLALAGLLLSIVVGSTWMLGYLPFGTFQSAGTAETADSNVPVTPVHQPAQAQPANTLLPNVEATLALTPTATLTPDVPANVVELLPTPTLTPAEIAASTTSVAIGVGASQPFDFQRYLQQQNRPDLVQLNIAAAQQGAILFLKGIVPSFEMRQALIEVAESIPGVTDVSAVDLLLRPAATYLVQPGDTLWDITYRIYGDVSRMPALIDANRDILPSPEALNVGMELKVPPLE